MRTWLHRIATNACLNALDSRSRRPLPSDLTGPGSLADAPHRPVGGTPRSPGCSRSPTRCWPRTPAGGRPGRHRRGAGQRPARVRGRPAAPAGPAAGGADPARRAGLAGRGGRRSAGDHHRRREQRAAARAGPAPRGSAQPAQRRPSRRPRTAGDGRPLRLGVPARRRRDPDPAAGRRGGAGNAAVPELVPRPGDRHRFPAARALAAPDRWRAIPAARNGQPAAGLYLRRDDGRHHAHSVHVFSVTGGGISWIAAFAEPGLFPTFGLPPIFPERNGPGVTGG